MKRKNYRVCWGIIPVLFIFFGIFTDNPCAAANKLRNLKQLKSTEQPWEISANKLVYKEKEKVYVADGNVVIKKGTQVLNAQKAIYDRTTGIAKVWGDVRFESQGDIIKGHKGVFNLKEKTGTIENGHIFLRENNLHITSRSLEKLSEDTYLAKNCKVTTCDGQTPAWSITASEVKVTVEGYGTARHAAFRVKDVPVLYFPYFIFPAKTKRQTGLLPPRFGYSGRNGLDMEIPFFWAISNQTDATFYERYMTERGFMQGLEFRYITGPGSQGAFMVDVMSDRKDKDLNDPDDAELSPFTRTNKTRYWFRGKADQKFPLEVQARLDVDYVSDQDYLKEFTRGLFGYEARPDLEKKWGRPFEERLSPFRTSNLLLSRLWESTLVQADSHYYQRPEHPFPNETPQPLFGLHLSKLISPVPGVPLHYSFETSYQNVWREDGEKGNEINLGPDIRMPLRLSRYLELEPSVSFDYEGRWVEQVDDDTDYGWARGYRGELRASSRLEKLFNVSMGNINRLRHTIRPALTYSYHATRSDNNLSWFDPLTDEGKTNKLTLSLENFLDTRSEDKEGKVSYRQWASLNLSQSYNIDEVRRASEPGIKRRPFDPLSISFTLKPIKLVDIYWITQWNHYDNEFTSNDLSIELNLDRSTGRKDHYKVEYQSSRGEYRNLFLSADIGLWGGFSVGGDFKKDFYADEDISSGAWVNYESQCWGIKVVAQRENEDIQFMVLFELKGLGQFRTW